MTCTENSENRLPKLKNVIKDQRIRAEPRCRSTSVRQSNIFQDDKTFKEIFGKEPWTLRNYRSSWTSILHLTTPRKYESRTPCISCFPIRTLDSERDPEPDTTPTTSC